MIKWTVAGKPRMALFAGERGVMTGEELTYDYNFEWVLYVKLGEVNRLTSSIVPSRARTFKNADAAL